jgi:hypothetical protein
VFGTLLINLGKISLYLNTPTPYSVDPSSLSLTPKPLKVFFFFSSAMLMLLANL